MALVSLHYHVSYVPPSDSHHWNVTVRTVEYPEGPDRIEVVHYSDFMELLSGGGTPEEVARDKFNVALRRWRKACLAQPPF